ncbi:MAG: glutaredoxin family protein [Candidatus Pacearchaeota archaeon]
MKVMVYSTPACPWCVKLKEWLKENKIDFKDIDVSTDEKAAMEMVEKSGQMGVPVTTIDNNVVIGFDVVQLKKLLKLK